MEESGDRCGNAATKEDAYDASGQAEDHGFNEELAEDVAGARAYGHADADFAGPLGDADQHDVHDAHTADHEGDEGHDEQEVRHHAAGGGEGLGDFGVIADLEIVRTAGGDVMAVT